MTTQRIIPPTLNLNGTSGVELCEMWLKASEAVTAAKRALAVCMPHGRDFPVAIGVTSQLLPLARDRHTDEMQRLADVQRYVDEMMVAIVRQRDMEV